MIALRELAGGGLIMLPSSVADFANAELPRLIGKTQQSPRGVIGGSSQILQTRLGRNRLRIRVPPQAI
jgi:hypothetical protein